MSNDPTIQRSNMQNSGTKCMRAGARRQHHSHLTTHTSHLTPHTCCTDAGSRKFSDRIGIPVTVGRNGLEKPPTSAATNNNDNNDNNDNDNNNNNTVIVVVAPLADTGPTTRALAPVQRKYRSQS